MSTLKMYFGTEETTTILDENGSTATAKIDYRGGKPKMPVRRVYKIRERVHSADEERQKYLEFSEELATTPTMLDPVWMPKERSKDGDANGYYYVVKGYTLLEF